jgi:hypothetical protein
MKNKILVLTVLLIAYSVAPAQLKERDHLLGPSIGLYTGPGAPSFGVNYEYQLSQLGDVAAISIGGVFRYTSYKSFYSDQNYYQYNYTTFGFQSNLNFNQIGDGKFVPFIGLVLGYNIVSANYVNHNGVVYNASFNNGFWLWGQFGLRYFFSPKVAGALRFGAGNFNFDVIEIGVDFKL